MKLDLNLELKFKRPRINKKLHPHTWMMIGSLSLAIVSLIVSVSFSMYALSQFSQGVENAALGQLLNQLQVDKADQLLREQTAEFTIETSETQTTQSTPTTNPPASADE